MIKCTECGKEISDKATACPHCGCPMTEILSATKENKKEEKVKPIKIKEPITPEQKKKRIFIMSVTAFVLIAAVALTWYFGIKIPQDKAYAEYLVTFDAYNQEIENYNSTVLNYNEKANKIIAANKELTGVIEEAQALIDCGDTPYESETMTTLNNTLKNSRNSICETPNIYEKKTALELDESLNKSLASKISEANESLNVERSEIVSATSEVGEESAGLSVPDYSKIIAEIKDEEELLENSYTIQKQITNPTQDFVLAKINNVENIANVVCATEENDPNGKLGKDGGYTAQIYFSSPLLGTETIAGDKLIDDVCIILRAIITESILCIKRSSHIKSVQPHLMRINFLVPKTAIIITGLSFKLAVKQIERFLVFRIFGLLINTEKNFPGIDAIQTVIG